MSREIKISLLMASRWYTDILRAADMFERFKCVVEMEPLNWTLTLKPRVRIERPLRAIITKLQEHPDNWPVAVWCHEPALIWTDPEIKMISTGYKFTMLRDYLKFLELDKFQKLEFSGSKPNGAGVKT